MARSMSPHPQIELHLCRPGLLPTAFMTCAARARSGLDATSTRVVDAWAAVEAASAGGVRRTLVVDGTLWSPDRVGALAPPAEAALRVVVWRPSALELVAELLADPRAVERAAEQGAQAERTHAAVVAAAGRLGPVEHRSLTDRGGRVVEAVADALGVAISPPPQPVAGVPVGADGAVDLAALAARLAGAWVDGRRRGGVAR